MSETDAFETVAYMRETMITPEPPPKAQGGPVFWLRENLFSTPMNAALTILSLLMIYGLVWRFWPWLSHSVWNANSLPECRAIIAERWGEGATGACWAVVKARWHQYLFGFYPRAIYWRPILAFGLLFVALAPLLYSDSARSRRLMLGGAGLLTVLFMWMAHAPNGPVITAIAAFAVVLAVNRVRPAVLFGFPAFYPFLAYWLLWGGSFWWIIALWVGILLGVGVWWAIARVAPLIGVGAGVVVAVLWWLHANDHAAAILQGLLPFSLPAVRSEVFGGFLLSAVIGVSAIATSLPAGIILALSRRSDMPVVKLFAVMFIEFIRGVPLITLLFVASLLLNYFMPPGTNFDKILRVVIMVSIFASAYMAEVIRGGLAALPKGQIEAGDSLGLTYWQAQRLIVLPQALKISIPPIVSTFIGVFKDTTLVVFISLYDPLKGVSDALRQDMAWKGIYWEPYIFSGLIFFILCFAMSRYSMYLENRLKHEHR